jgi:hypothetical protein
VPRFEFGDDIGQAQVPQTEQEQHVIDQVSSLVAEPLFRFGRSGQRHLDAFFTEFLCDLGQAERCETRGIAVRRIVADSLPDDRFELRKKA